MISHFYIHISVGDIDCRIQGWRLIEEPKSVYVERILIDGHQYGEEYSNNYLARYSWVYRELERKLGLPALSLRYKPIVSEQSDVNL